MFGAARWRLVGWNVLVLTLILIFLETVVYTMDKIETGEKESSILPHFLAGDRLLLMVHGEVIAGIDFQMLKISYISS